MMTNDLNVTGSRELLIDDFLFEERKNLNFRLHTPVELPCPPTWKKYPASFSWRLGSAGLDPERWGNRVNYMAWGMLHTSPEELSLYHGHKPIRYQLRADGFISLNAGTENGTFLTRPLWRDGGGLELNLATSAGGGFRLEVCDVSGRPLPGYSLADFESFYGDRISFEPDWHGKSLSGLPPGYFRLRGEMAECDLYSISFPYRKKAAIKQCRDTVGEIERKGWSPLLKASSKSEIFRANFSQTPSLLDIRGPSGKNSGSFHDIFPVEPGGKYLISWKVRHEKAEFAVAVILGLNEKGSILRNVRQFPITRFQLKSGWQELKLPLEIPADGSWKNCRFIKLNLSVAGKNSKTWIDDFRIEKQSAGISNERH